MMRTTISNLIQIAALWATAYAITATLALAQGAGQ
jgi:hypothetical protein